MSTTENQATPEDPSSEGPGGAHEIECSETDAKSTAAPSSDSELQRLREQNADLQDRVLRVQAELENFRRRSQKESAEAMKYQSLPVIRDFLPGIDNLRRAIDAAEQSGDTQNLVDGIRMVSQQFVDALKSHHCEAIHPLHEPFDANFHEALSQIPSADYEPMTVLQVIESGYKIHDRVVRPAKVMVSRLPPGPVTDSATGASH